MRVVQANARTPVLRMFMWGPPGKYWTDVAHALLLFQDGDEAQATAIFDRWAADKRLPEQAKESLSGFAMLGKVMQNDRPSIVRMYEEQRRAGKHSTVPLTLAARALAEEQRYQESFNCLKHLKEQSARTAPSTIDISFVPFFALLALAISWSVSSPSAKTGSRCLIIRAFSGSGAVTRRAVSGAGAETFGASTRQDTGESAHLARSH